MMIARYGIPAPPQALGRSRVSHKLQSSPQEKLKLRLALFALFVACSTSIFLLVNAFSSPWGFPVFRGEYRSRGLDQLAPIAAEPLSSSWAYYSPYNPAGKFDGSTREGCVVSQVNIVSSVSLR